MKDELYAAASDYSQLPLCDVLDKNEIFAVRFENELLYCSALRHEDGIAIIVCPGDCSLRLLRSRFAKSRKLSITELTELDGLVISIGPKSMLREDDIAQINALGINYKGKNIWPLFRRMQPGKYPRFVSDERDERIICCVLRAARYLSQCIDRSAQLSLFSMESDCAAQSTKSLGFSDVLQDSASVPLLTESESGFDIEKINVRFEHEESVEGFDSFDGCKAALVNLPSFIVGNPPFLPYTFIWIDENDKATALPPCAEMSELAAELRRFVIRRPERLLVRDRKTEDFLTRFDLMPEVERTLGTYKVCEDLLDRLYRHFALPEDRNGEPSTERLHRLKKSMRRGGIDSVCTELESCVSEFNECDAVFYKADNRVLSRIASSLLIEKRSKMCKDELNRVLEEYYLCPKTLCKVLSLLSDEAYETLLRCVERPLGIDCCSEDACLGLCFLYLAHIEENGMITVKQRLCNAIKAVERDECMQLRSRRADIENYILAGVNLFGAIEKARLIEIFNQNEESTLSDRELEATLAPAVYGMPGCAYNADMEHIFSSEYSSGSDPLHYLFKLQRSHEYHLPQDSFVAYCDPAHYEPCPQMDELAALCMSIWGEKGRQALGILHLSLRAGLCNYESLESVRGSFGETLSESDGRYSKFCKIYDSALCCVGRWKMRGNAQSTN